MSIQETEDGQQSVLLNLTFPIERVDQPVLAQAIKLFGVVADIRRAQIEPETGGYIALKLTGTDQQIDASVRYFKENGVGVGFIGSDEVQAS